VASIKSTSRLLPTPATGTPTADENIKSGSSQVKFEKIHWASQTSADILTECQTIWISGDIICGASPGSKLFSKVIKILQKSS